eukprot:TRINITY_DN14258_c0_g1_i1.p1 TRINITY_DN14258_c0_g1~~TRINITY_DN14258_c0_g1_i1.p1  ORF type:complete len:993 (+),score=190.89 TRINITY_DN14258_c0_g1_i1:108-2981(+)
MREGQSFRQRKGSGIALTVRYSGGVGGVQPQSGQPVAPRQPGAGAAAPARAPHQQLPQRPPRQQQGLSRLRLASRSPPHSAHLRSRQSPQQGPKRKASPTPPCSRVHTARPTRPRAYSHGTAGRQRFSSSAPPPERRVPMPLQRRQSHPQRHSHRNATTQPQQQPEGRAVQRQLSTGGRAVERIDSGKSGRAAERIDSGKSGNAAERVDSGKSGMSRTHSAPSSRIHRVPRPLAAGGGDLRSVKPKAAGLRSRRSNLRPQAADARCHSPPRVASDSPTAGRRLRSDSPMRLQRDSPQRSTSPRARPVSPPAPQRSPAPLRPAAVHPPVPRSPVAAPQGSPAGIPSRISPGCSVLDGRVQQPHLPVAEVLAPPTISPGAQQRIRRRQWSQPPNARGPQPSSPPRSPPAPAAAAPEGDLPPALSPQTSAGALLRAAPISPEPPPIDAVWHVSTSPRNSPKKGLSPPVLHDSDGPISAGSHEVQAALAALKRAAVPSALRYSPRVADAAECNPMQSLFTPPQRSPAGSDSRKRLFPPSQSGARFSSPAGSPAGSPRGGHSPAGSSPGASRRKVRQRLQPVAGRVLELQWAPVSEESGAPRFGTCCLAGGGVAVVSSTLLAVLSFVGGAEGATRVGWQRRYGGARGPWREVRAPLAGAAARSITVNCDWVGSEVRFAAVPVRKRDGRAGAEVRSESAEVRWPANTAAAALLSLADGQPAVRVTVVSTGEDVALELSERCLKIKTLGAADTPLGTPVGSLARAEFDQEHAVYCELDPDHPGRFLLHGALEEGPVCLGVESAAERDFVVLLIRCWAAVSDPALCSELLGEEVSVLWQEGIRRWRSATEPYASGLREDCLRRACEDPANGAATAPDEMPSSPRALARAALLTLRAAVRRLALAPPEARARIWDTGRLAASARAPPVSGGLLDPEAEPLGSAQWILPPDPRVVYWQALRNPSCYS